MLRRYTATEMCVCVFFILVFGVLCLLLIPQSSSMERMKKQELDNR